MLCYRCGSHVPDAAETCEKCGQRLAGGPKGAVSLPPRKRANDLDGAPFKVGDLLSQRYRIKSAIGVGPCGVVYRAADEQLDGDVCLKLLQPRLMQTADERAIFSKALRVSRKFTHPSLARTLEDGDHDGWAYYTSPFVDGLPLRKVIEPRVSKGNFFALKELEPIFTQLASALDAAHVLAAHGDLKPENVLILPDVLKVTDFGLTRALPRPPFIQALKPSRADRYLAPEILAGHDFDGRADVYALGVILGEMVAGAFPSEGEVPELRAKARDLPLSIEGLYRRALNENPQVRPATAGALVAELFGQPKKPASVPPRLPLPPPVPTPPPTRADSPAALPRLNTEPSLETRLRPPTEEIPVDATIPISEEELRTRLGRPQARAETRPLLEVNTLAPPPPPARRGPDGEGPTMALPAGGADMVSRPTGPPALFAAARGDDQGGSRGLLLLLLLSVSGVAVGITGGMWLLKQLRPAPAPVPAQTLPRPVKPTPTPTEEPVRPRETPPPAIPVPVPEPTKQIDLPKQAEERPAEKTEPKVVSAKVTHPAPADVELGCPGGMRLIPAGSFKMGTARDDPMMGFDERTLTGVELKAYCVDEFEFPNRRGVAPKVGVSWSEARKSCESKHKRLCSEPEWEKACKGPENARYPYGNSFDANACNTEDASGQDRSLGQSGKFARCRSGYGAMDMSGNAAEWTASAYGSGSEKALKGGAYNRPDYAARCSARKSAAASSRSSEVGFRCCADPVR